MSITTRLDENGNPVVDKYWKKNKNDLSADYSISFDRKSINDLSMWKGEEKGLEGSYSRIKDTFITQWMDLITVAGHIGKESDRRQSMKNSIRKDMFNDSVMNKVEEEGLEERLYTYANDDDIIDPSELIKHNQEVKQRRLSLDEKFHLTEEFETEWKQFEDRVIEDKKAYHLGKTQRRTMGEYTVATIAAHVLSPVELGLTFAGVKGFSVAGRIGGKFLPRLGLSTAHIIKNPVTRKAVLSAGKEIGGLASGEVVIQGILREAAEGRGEEYTFGDQLFGVLSAGLLGGLAIGLVRGVKAYRANVTVAQLSKDLTSGGEAVGKVAKTMAKKAAKESDFTEVAILHKQSEDMVHVGKVLRQFKDQKQKAKHVFSGDTLEYFTAAQHEKIFQGTGITPTVDVYTYSTKKLSELVDEASKNLPPSARGKVLVEQLVENREALDQTVKFTKESKMSAGVDNVAELIDDSKEINRLLKKLDEPNLPGFSEALVIKELNEKLIAGGSLKRSVKVINTKPAHSVHAGANNVVSAVANATESFEHELSGKIKGYRQVLDKSSPLSEITLSSKEGKNLVIASITGDTKNLSPKVGKLALGVKDMLTYTHDKLIKLGHQISEGMRSKYFPSLMVAKSVKRLGKSKFVDAWIQTHDLKATAKKMKVAVEEVIPSVKRTYKEIVGEIDDSLLLDSARRPNLHERLWVLKDASSQADWLALTGPKTVREVVDGYIRTKSRMMAVKYYFGNDVDKAWKLYNKLGTPDFVKKNPRSLQARMWRYFNDAWYRQEVGALKGTPNEAVHVVVKTLNSMSAIKHLVEVALASTGDLPMMLFSTQAAYKDFYLSLKTVARAGKNIFSINKQEVDYLTSQGLALVDVASSVGDRFMNPITGNLGKLVRGTLNFGLLKRVVEAMRASIDITTSRQLGKQLTKNWADLSDQARHMFKLMNISESDFIKVKKMGAVMVTDIGDDGKLLDLQKIKSLDIDLGFKFDHYFKELRDTGSPLLSSSGRSVLTGGYTSSSLPRGLRDIASLYLNFAGGVMESMNRLIRYSGSPEEAAKVMIPFVVTVTAFTGMTMQLRELTKGRSLRPMNDKKFWIESLVRTGVVGPLIEKGAMAEIYDNSVISNFIPPGIDVALEVAGGIKRAAFEGKTDKLTKTSLELLPYRNFWNRLFLKRLLHDPIRKKLSPKEFRQFQKFEKTWLSKRGQKQYL